MVHFSLPASSRASGLLSSDVDSDGEGWARQLGEKWSVKLRAHGIGPQDLIVECGPGYSDTIGRALAANDHRGPVLLVEPNGPARTWALQRYCKRLPQAHVTGAAEIDSEAFSAKRVDALVANHLLDDLILNTALSRKQADSTFAAMTPGAECGDSFIAIWRNLLADADLLSATIELAALNFSRVIEQLRPGVVLLNQYPSWRHHRSGLDKIHFHACEVMRALTEKLPTVGLVAELLVDPQDGMLWLLALPSSQTRYGSAEDE